MSTTPSHMEPETAARPGIPLAAKPRPAGPVPKPFAGAALPELPDEPDSQHDLRTHLKAFAGSPNFSTFVPVAKSLIEIAELSPVLKQELGNLFTEQRPREELLMLSDGFQGYEPLVKRLPSRDDAASWAQDRARYPELYTILGIVTALAKLANADRMLTQSVLTAEPARQRGDERADLNKRLMGAYEASLLPGGSSFLQLVENESQDKNSLAATRLLKGYLVPIFEIDHGIKAGFFKKLGRAFSEETISPELADLAEGGMTPEQSRALTRLRNAAVPPEAKSEPTPGVLLKELVPPATIDLTFVDNVLRAKAENPEKVIFLHGAIGAAELVQEQAYYAIVERLPRGVKACGDVNQTRWEGFVAEVKGAQKDLYDYVTEAPFDIPLLFEALSKLSAVENKGYLAIANRTMFSACQASLRWNDLHSSLRGALPKLIDQYTEQALKRRRKE